MYHLKVPVLLLMLLVLLRCVTAAPSNRYFSPSSSSEQESALLDSEGWLAPGLVSNPFLNLMGTRLQRGLTPMNSHNIQKRKCNTATCVTQRLADFLVRSSNTIGTVYAPTNVGSATYGKRDLLQPPSYLPL
ncbi:islet amyloid polypeptide [Seriola lalandi dorsalis]|uniref:Islet amyloid polypeptide n=1 Tax=Seriola lalandi dorsalis TaxID=1841481 RepID=A0A3B4XWD1_SERLL|nr:islet amyloid polypeptide [Seriola lalandi dorsalis]XP_056224056.1 calcitonin gene-related peptide 2 [Seriola aureovittata]